MFNKAASTRCSVDNKENLSANTRSEYASDFCHDRKSACSGDNKEKLSTNIRSEFESDFCHGRKSAFIADFLFSQKPLAAS